MKFKKAFTLTEVLIAMAVLGIIVSASVPVILGMSPNKNAIMLKKAYYTTETIVNSLINDPELYNPEEGFNDTSQVNVNGVNAVGPIKFRCLFASKLNINPSPEDNDDRIDTVLNSCVAKGQLSDPDHPDPIDNFIVQSNDGTTWILSAAMFGTETSDIKIYVDVKNGFNGWSYYSPGYTGSDFDSNGLSEGTVLQCEGAQVVPETCVSTGSLPTEPLLKSSSAKKASARLQRYVDRAVFTITADGQVKVDDGQQYILDIISGKTKIIGK